MQALGLQKVVMTNVNSNKVTHKTRTLLD